MSGQQPHQPPFQQPGQQQPGQQQPGYQQPPMQGYSGPSTEERTAAILAHLSAPIAFVLTAGWLSIVGPLVVWLIYKDRSPAVRQAAAGAFNFNLSAWALSILGWILFFTVVGIPIALLIWIVVFVVSAIAHLKGAIRASNGQAYSYPFQIPILR